MTLLKNQTSNYNNKVCFKTLNCKSSKLVAMNGHSKLSDLIQLIFIGALFKNLITAKEILKKEKAVKV